MNQFVKNFRAVRVWQIIFVLASMSVAASGKENPASVVAAEPQQTGNKPKKPPGTQAKVKNESVNQGKSVRASKPRSTPEKGSKKQVSTSPANPQKSLKSSRTQNGRENSDRGASPASASSGVSKNQNSKGLKGDRAKKPIAPTPAEQGSGENLLEKGLVPKEPHLLVWLVPLGFFTLAGAMLLVQKYQHLLFKGKPSKLNQKIVRPESRAEVALGSVLSSLDLDTTRADEQISPPDINPSRQKSRLKDTQDTQKGNPAGPEDDQSRTRVSGQKQQSDTSSSGGKGKGEGITPPNQSAALDATLESAKKIDLSVSGVSPIENQQQAVQPESAFLTAPPSAMNWVGNTLLDPKVNPDDARLRIKNASSYQNAVQKNALNKKSS